MAGLVAVILAGGEGRRFGGDKIRALVDGEPAIARVARALREAGAEEVYASTRGEWRCRLYRGLGGLDGCVMDPPSACGGGPGAALLGVAEAAVEAGWRRVLVAPGDAPWLTGEAVSRLLWFSGGVEATGVLHGGGFLESLLQVLDGGFLASALPGLRALCGLRGELRGSDTLRLAPRLRLVGSGLLTPWRSVFAHINTREALRVREPRNPLGDGVVELRGPGLDPSLGLRGLCGALAVEEERYRALGVLHLWRQARRDREKLCSRGGGSVLAY